MSLGMDHDYPSGAIREHNTTHGGPYQLLASLRDELNEERAARMRAESDLAAERSTHSWTRSKLQTARHATRPWILSCQDHFHLLKSTSSVMNMPPSWFSQPQGYDYSDPTEALRWTCGLRVSVLP
jgi:hypothetical protein